MHRGCRKTETKAVKRASSPVAGATATVFVATGASAAPTQWEIDTTPVKIRAATPITIIGNLNGCFI
jgi:hypothetical protein